MKMIPELIKRRAEGYLESFCIEHSDRLSCPYVDLLISWDDDSAVIEARDGCNPPQPVARFRYNNDLCQWSLFAPREGSGWRLCLEVQPTLNLQQLLAYLEQDPLNLFWPPSFSCFS